MPAILRIDVDKPFLVCGSAPRPRKPCKGLKKGFTKRTCLFYSLEYLKPCKELIKGLNSRGLKTSLFFPPFTVPNKDFAEELLKKGHSVGLHVVHTNGYKDFSMDLIKYLYFYSKSSKGAI